MASSQICLTQLPLDVFLYISSFFRLLDSLSFSMVCKATFSLSSERTFWISALQNERLIQPIACTTHENLLGHDLRGLRRIALHTLRLQQNWNSEKPKIMGDIQTLYLGLSWNGGRSLLHRREGIFRVPGTELYIFNCPDRTTIELWHIGWKQMVGEPIKVSPGICDVSSAVDLPGKFMIAFLAAPSTSTRFQVFVVCVEHSLTNVALKLVLRHEFAGGGIGTVTRNQWGTYLGEGFVGTLCHDMSYTFGVVALSLSTRNEMFIDANLFSLEVPLTIHQIYGARIVLTDEDLGILIADPSGKSYVLTVPKSCVLQTDDRLYSTLSFGNKFTFFEGYCQDDADASRTSTVMTNTTHNYGVHAMTIDSPPPSDGNTAFTDIIFWVQPRVFEDKTVPLVPLVLPNGMPGSLFESNFAHHLFQSFSGRKGLIMLDVAEEGLAQKLILRLLSCDPEALRPITYRDLTLPDFLAPSRIQRLSIDDHLGVVSIIDSDGMLHAIPYA